MNKKYVFIAGLGILGLVLITRVKVDAYSLTVDKISNESTIGALEADYNAMNALYVTGKIDNSTYDLLYSAYVTRFNQLIGGA